MPPNIRNLPGRAWQSPTLTTWGSLGLRLAGMSLLLPLVLNRLPVEEASLWFVFSAVLALQILADFGFAPTFTRAVAYARAGDGDRSALGAVIATMRHVYSRLGIAALLLGGIGGSLAVVHPIAQIRVQALGWCAWAAVAIGGSITLRGGMFSAFLQGSERIALYRRYEMLVGFVALIATLIVLAVGGGLLGLALTSQAGVLASVFVNRHLAIRAAPAGAWTCPSKPDRRVMGETWPAAWRSGVGVLMTFGTIQGSSVVYAQLAAPSEVAAYLLAQRLMQILVTLANVPFYAGLPTMARLFAERRVAELAAGASRGMFRANWVLVTGLLLVALGAVPVLTLVGSKTPFVSPAVWWVLGLGMLLERVGAMHLQLHSVTNQIVWHIANGVSGIIMIAAMPLFYHYFGVLGFPLAITLGYAVFYVPYSIRSCHRAFPSSIRSIELGGTLAPVAFVIIAVSLALWASYR